MSIIVSSEERLDVRQALLFAALVDQFTVFRWTPDIK